MRDDLNGSVSDDLHGSLTLLQQPRLFVPLLYAKCSSSDLLTLTTFTSSLWPRHTPSSTSIHFSIPPKGCERLRACATLPVEASAGCGGHPERCVELDLLPHLTTRFENSSPPRWLDGFARGAVVHSQLSLPSLVECQGASTSYIKDEAGRVVAYGEGKLHMQVSAPRTLRRECQGERETEGEHENKSRGEGENQCERECD